MDPYSSPYPSRRRPIYGHRGVVATSQILASQAGFETLRAGGNAVDAIVAAAAAKTVVEPTANGIGGDAFALVWDGSKLHGLNGSGRAPAALTLEKVRGAGHSAMPPRGWFTVTVPGVPLAWADLHGRFGRLPFERVVAPAIALAEQGFAISPFVGRAWGASAKMFGAESGAEFRPWSDTFTRDGRAPEVGDWFSLPDHAKTLRRIAESKADDFYTGELAGTIAGFAAASGGFIAREDLARHASTWVDPIGTSYRGHEVWEIPPNGQGITALAALNILEGFDLGKMPRESVKAYHLQIEAMRLAFADARRYVADPAMADVPISGLLDKGYAAERRKLIGEQARAREAGEPPRGGTVYLCAADGDGLMVSYIQSNYSGFGSGVVVPGTGIALQNRGSGFSLDAAQPNALAPGKRPYHTIIPGFLTRQGEAVGPFGVMGGFMQPQGHQQVVSNTVDWGMNPQAALDAPRWQIGLQGTAVDVEFETPRHVVEGLIAHGHEVRVQANLAGFGRGQAIWRMANGGMVAGSEGRTDGCALGW